MNNVSFNINKKLYVLQWLKLDLTDNAFSAEIVYLLKLAFQIAGDVGLDLGSWFFNYLIYQTYSVSSITNKTRYINNKSTRSKLILEDE